MKVIPLSLKKVECFRCQGKGEAVFSCCTGDPVDPDHARCPVCKENLGEEKCDECEGRGWNMEEIKPNKVYTPYIK